MQGAVCGFLGFLIGAAVMSIGSNADPLVWGFALAFAVFFLTCILFAFILGVVFFVKHRQELAAAQKKHPTQESGGNEPGRG